MSSSERHEGSSPERSRRTLLPSWSRQVGPEARTPSWMSPALGGRAAELHREVDFGAADPYARVFETADRGPSVQPLVVPTEHRATTPPARSSEPSNRASSETGGRPASVRPSVLRVELDAERAALEALREEVESEREEARAMARRFAELAAELTVARHEASEGLDRRVVELAMVIAESLVGECVRREPETALRFVREALSTLAETPRAVVRAAPNAAAVLFDLLGGERAELDGVAVELKRDATLEGHDCIVETPSQRVDGRVRQRLDAIGRALFAEVAREPDEEEGA